MVKHKNLLFGLSSPLRHLTWSRSSVLAAILWYIGLFPGRIGYDPIQAISLMRNDQSTDWWTSWYFRILEVSTFRGNSIWLASLISILVLFLSLKFFIFSLPGKRELLEKISFVVCISPLFGNFAVTVSHDTFYTSGILLLAGYSYRLKSSRDFNQLTTIPILAAVLLLTSKSGYIVLISFIMFLLISKVPKLKVVLLALFTLSFFALSNVGVTKSPTPLEIMPAIADLKCVAQHPEANLSELDWNYLATITQIEKWKVPVTCSSMDEALIPLTDSNLESINKIQFLRNYLSIASKNGAIVLQAHLQRSSQALPPPFFQGPENQVDQNRRNPVGLNTNTALQLGPEVLHPSIDDPSLGIELGLFGYVQQVFLFFSFLINQASWFWGWGGFWLWPAMLIPIIFLKISRVRDLLYVSYPILVNHLFLFIFSPIPAPRYVMSTVLIGFTYTLLAIAKWFDKQKNRE